MLKKITLSLCCLVLHTLTAQTNNCTVNPLALQYYTEDIRSMANDYMWQTQQDTTAIQIPQQHFDFIASKLSAVMALNTAETDSIFNKYCVHDVREVYELKQIRLFIDPNVSWTQAWINQQNTTGNAVIDSFMSANNLSLESHVELPFDTSFGTRHYVILSSPIVFNVEGAVDWFMGQLGVLMAERNTAFGGAGRMSVYQQDAVTYMDFITEWSDCGDGCDNLIQWVFAVDAQCNASLYYRTEFHVWDTWPEAPEANCNIVLGLPEHKEEQAIVVYPNPITTYATVMVSARLLGTTMGVYNTLGQTMKTIPIDNTTLTVDLSTLPEGIYYLKHDDVTQTVKLIKR